MMERFHNIISIRFCFVQLCVNKLSMFFLLVGYTRLHEYDSLSAIC